MAFNRLHFSSVNNQQCAGERIQTWQYETVDPMEDLIAGNYFAEIANSLHVNDLIWVIQMSPDGKTAQSRYQLTVRVDEMLEGPNSLAVVAVPELADATTSVVDFDALTATETITLPTFTSAMAVVGATAVLLGALDTAGESITLAIKSSDPTTVYSGTLSGPSAYGTALALAAGAADTDTVYTVTMTPTSVPAGTVGTLRVFIQTKVA
jgi:hypothetical protein